MYTNRSKLVDFIAIFALLGAFGCKQKKETGSLTITPGSTASLTTTANLMSAKYSTALAGKVTPEEEKKKKEAEEATKLKAAEDAKKKEQEEKDKLNATPNPFLSNDKLRDFFSAYSYVANVDTNVFDQLNAETLSPDDQNKILDQYFSLFTTATGEQLTTNNWALFDKLMQLNFNMYVTTPVFKKRVSEAVKTNPLLKDLTKAELETAEPLLFNLSLFQRLKYPLPSEKNIFDVYEITKDGKRHRLMILGRVDFSSAQTLTDENIKNGQNFTNIRYLIAQWILSKAKRNFDKFIIAGNDDVSEKDSTKGIDRANQIINLFTTFTAASCEAQDWKDAYPLTSKPEEQVKNRRVEIVISDIVLPNKTPIAAPVAAK